MGMELVSFLRLKNPSMLPLPSSWRDLLSYRKKQETLYRERPLIEYLRDIVLSSVSLIMVLLSIQIVILKSVVTLVEHFVTWIQNQTEEIVKEMDQKDRETLNADASRIGVKHIPVQQIFAVSMFTAALILELVK